MLADLASLAESVRAANEQWNEAIEARSSLGDAWAQAKATEREMETRAARARTALLDFVTSEEPLRVG